MLASDARGQRRARGAGRRRGTSWLLLAASLALSLAIAEYVSRRLLPEGYFVWPPGFEMTFDAGDVIHGVSFPTRFSINEMGMRGELPSPQTQLRALALGGSTTICVYLDDDDAWPLRLQRRLEASGGPGSAWVGNAGRPGHKTSHHVLQAEKLLDQFPDVNFLILLLGFNDFVPELTALTYPDLALEPSPQQLLALSFSLYPGWGADAPWYLRNWIGRAWWRLSWRPLRGTEELQPMDAHGAFQAALRRHRRSAGRLLGRLPDLGPGIARYVANVKRILDVADRHDVRVLLITQPTLWRPGLSESERSLLWAGGPPFYALRDGADYYTVEALADGMARYNLALLEVCRERAALCLDAASELPRSGETFFDDVHFTDAGSARFAEIVAGRLRAEGRAAGGGDGAPTPARPVAGL